MIVRMCHQGLHHHVGCTTPCLQTVHPILSVTLVQLYRPGTPKVRKQAEACAIPMHHCSSATHYIQNHTDLPK